MTAILRPRITPTQFVAKWRPVQLSERAAAHSHFNDVCDLLDHPRPLDVDPKGEWFTFEKGVKKAGGGDGFADVWKREAFAWEYKKKKRNLDDALDQLARYALALESPPLHIVCDTDRFRIVTAQTNSVAKSYDLSLDDVLDSQKFTWLEAAFHDPNSLKPGDKKSDLTKKAADKFSTLAQRLQAKGYDPGDVAHFVNRLVFLFFAEDVKILKEGYFRRTVAELAGRPQDAKDLLTGLFQTFQTGGRFGLDRLPWINGGLFDEREALPLDEHEVGLLQAASSQRWAHIDPTIFGTLFERFLDPSKRDQISAHYTDIGKIQQIIEPVLMRPLREEWQRTRSEIEALVSKASKTRTNSKFWQRAEERRSAFLERLRTLSVLDPACGSGNFLYLALHGVKDLEHAANQECETMGLPPRMPMVGPEILRGIEINPLAADLARATIWIGDIQWAVQNGIRSRPEPILRKLNLVENRDALLNDDGSEAEWPEAEFIIGNPPFVGAKVMNRKLGKDETQRIRAAFADRLPGFTDIVCFWFEKAQAQILNGKTKRVGLVATKAIAKNTNLPVMKRICANHTIFNAYANEPWIVDGAAVRVSLICFAQELEPGDVIKLDGRPVAGINADLSSGVDVTKAVVLRGNRGKSALGIQKSGPFDIDGALARKWLRAPSNPNGLKNINVLKPYWNGDDLTGRCRDKWLIDLPANCGLAEAALWEAPFKYLANAPYDIEDPESLTLCNERAKARDQHAQTRWWEPYWPRPELRRSIQVIKRYIVTPETSEHRIFAWLSYPVLPDKNLVVFPFDDETMFGILHSRFHEMWTTAIGNRMGAGNQRRYNNSVVFDTFPFPEEMGPGIPNYPMSVKSKAKDIASAAAELDKLRSKWLSPSDLIKTIPEVVSGLPDRLIPANAESAVMLRKRTYTDLYNEGFPWLTMAHSRLDAAVAAAYGWPEDISTEDALAALLELNQKRAAAQGKA